MLVVDLFLYTWLSLICCMCTRLCYEVHLEKYPNSKFSYTYVKRKTYSVLYHSREPLIQESELSESVTDIERPVEEPPDWVRN